MSEINPKGHTFQGTYRRGSDPVDVWREDRPDGTKAYPTKGSRDGIPLLIHGCKEDDLMIVIEGEKTGRAVQRAGYTAASYIGGSSCAELADYMRDLLGDLLDVARIETGELSVAPAPADVATLVDEARSRFQSGGGRNNLRIDLPPELPLVMADGRRIIQVLNNLLTNAARYSHEASAIGVSAVREGYHVAVSVTDEGRGIAAERLPHLFRKFSRIDGEDRRRDIAGSGLGLAICKGIVEAHGGRIWAESDGPGLGARFTFTIPVAQDAAIGATHLPVRSRRSERERERILAVDDDPQTLRYVRDALARAGYAPIVTGDPQEATSLVRANAPHLVLPGTDGMELMKEILR